MVDAHGEIAGEAVLMGRLEWPRFRRFSDGQQVQLPIRVAEAFEGLETALWTGFGGKPKCAGCGDELVQGNSEFLVDCSDVERLTFETWCRRHFSYSFPSRAKRNRSAPRDKRGVSYRAAKQRDQEPTTIAVNRERLDISLHK